MTPEHVDVLIVGAGLSGVGAACHLRRRHPGRTFALLEARAATGGTWDLFRYPGVRSDSDMFTLGYSFAPWTAPKSLADGDTIRDYLRRTADEHDVTRHIRLRHRVQRAEWDSHQARWTVHVHREDTTDTVVLTCSFLYACTGYYRYEAGHTPHFTGQDRFTGRIVHPQHWPAGLDLTGCRVVVIGSGATAVTLVPALARQAARVTMLQRSPTYLLPLSSRDRIADALRRLLPAHLAHQTVRLERTSCVATANYQQPARPRPGTRAAASRGGAPAATGFDVESHFTPRYDPWDQRLCVVPDGDLFTVLSDGRAEIVTDTVATFTAQGIRLASGRELPADVVVTATGLDLLALGGITLRVDGTDVDLPETVAYQGMMLSGVPNFAMTIGYTNASWTLKADLVAGYVCRLLRHLDRTGTQIVTPLAPPPGPRTPLIGLTSGYVRRGVARLPRRAPGHPGGCTRTTCATCCPCGTDG